ncbi:MAG: ATP-binding protein [Alphaproteobacteria bacterium]
MSEVPPGNGPRDWPEFSQQLIDGIPNPIYVTRDDGICVGCNLAFEAISGMSRDLLVGRSLSPVLPRDLARLYRDTERAISTLVGRHTFRNTVTYADGSIHDVEIHKTRFGSDGAHVVTTLVDVTTHRRAEEAQRAAKERAEEAGRVKSRFLAMVSHEIRTPMNAILGLTDLLKETRLEEVQNKYVNLVAQAGEHLLTLVDDILDFSKIEANRIELESIVFDLHALLDSVSGVTGVRAEQKGLAMHTFITPGLARYWRGDPHRLRQVLTNLLGNAVKFTATGTVILSVYPGTEKDVLRFAVADTGPGIPRNKLRTIFDPFAQADASTTRSHGGTGLGLAICRQLAALMGGSIEVASQLRVGSTFSFSVTLIPATEDEIAAQLAAAKETAPSSGHLPPSRILLVDDSDLNQLVVRNLLAGTPCVIDVADNGATAVALEATCAYDLVLMDIQMPVMDGYDATMAIRRREKAASLPAKPIIALTAGAFKEDRDAAIVSGCTDYLAKPVRKGMLMTLLRRYLGGGTGHPGDSSQARIEKTVDNELDHLLPAFFGQMESDIERMREALAGSDWDALGRLAHSARGHCMLFGFQNLAPWLGQIDRTASDLGKPGDLDGVEGPASTSELPAILEAFASALKDQEKLFTGSRTRPA